jgi:hypothetical protein
MSGPSPQPLSPGGRGANKARGEAALIVGGEALVLRPSFEALIAAEEELGPLFGLVVRAAEGRLKLAEIVALIWHCLAAPPQGLTRERLGAAVAEGGLARTTPVLRVLLTQILQGNSPLPRGEG